MQFISEVKDPLSRYESRRKMCRDLKKSQMLVWKKKKKRYVFTFLRPTHFFVFKTTEKCSYLLNFRIKFYINSFVFCKKKKKNRDNDNEMKFK